MVHSPCKPFTSIKSLQLSLSVSGTNWSLLELVAIFTMCTNLTY